MTKHDQVNHPSHYTSREVECIDVAELLKFCPGNAVKYLWRMHEKGNPLQDVRKAQWYLERERSRFGSVSISSPFAAAKLKCVRFDDWRDGAIASIVQGRLAVAAAVVRLEIEMLENQEGG